MKEKLIFVNNCLEELRKIVPKDTIVDAEFIRFQDGSGKVELPTECRDQDVFVICDVNDKTPNPYTGHVLSPDDHIRDLTRVVGALKDNPNRKTLIVPFQPYGRQHRRAFGESTEAADFLRECHYLGFKNILTVDSHDPNVAAAISKHNFDNMFVTNEMVTELVINEGIDYRHPENILIVAPDSGAEQRARHFADCFGCNYSYFSKRRDVSIVKNGKNPIISKQYVGFLPEGKTVILVDDMISSGGSIIETAVELKKRGAEKIYVCATFGLFTEGTEKFIKCYEDNIINGTYISNLTYLKEQPMTGIHVINCAKQLQDYINAIHEGKENIRAELGFDFVPIATLVESANVKKENEVIKEIKPEEQVKFTVNLSLGEQVNFTVQIKDGEEKQIKEKFQEALEKLNKHQMNLVQGFGRILKK